MTDTQLADQPPPPSAPAWPIAFAVTAGYGLLLLGIDTGQPHELLRPTLAPLTALGGLLVYWCFLWLITRRDPRI